MSGQYGIGGYDGPSERLPRDAGGVEMQAQAGVPFNRQGDERMPPGTLASADDPATRRRLPWIALGLMIVIVLFSFYYTGPYIAALFGGGFIVIGGLVAWLRSMD
jgi:hypothetical protein